MSTEAQPNQFSRSERTWAMFTHLAALSQLIGIPFGNIIGPLIMWIIKKEQYPFVDSQGKAAINFQISMLIYAALAPLLVVFLVRTAGVGEPEFMLAGIVLFAAIIITDIVQTIIAAVSANDGKAHHYPLAIRFIK